MRHVCVNCTTRLDLYSSNVFSGDIFLEYPTDRNDHSDVFFEFIPYFDYGLFLA